MRYFIFTLIFLCNLFGYSQTKPNILLIIADDVGVDVFNGYHQPTLIANIPTLDSLRGSGITFQNVFSTPMCAPSRAAIMSGKYGLNTGVTGVPGNLPITDTSIFTALKTRLNTQYNTAVIGKWHISHPIDNTHPYSHGVDYFMGLMESGVSDYYKWDRTQDSVTVTDTNYVTTVLTDTAISWISKQSKPWFLWMAHPAPHSPFHVPPANMFTTSNPTTNRQKYRAMLESVDYSTNKILSSMTTQQRDNTIIIFVGDNGTPGGVGVDYPTNQFKSTVYQGGVRVPLIISGKGVNRTGEKAFELIHITDLYATILEAAGIDLNGGIYNSKSFVHLLGDSSGTNRKFNYTEIKNNLEDVYAIRNEQYKLIVDEINNTEELYDLFTDSLETDDLIVKGLTNGLQTIRDSLYNEAQAIRTGWSCQDGIKNGDEEDIDCGGTSCNNCLTGNVENSIQSIEIYPNPASESIKIDLPNKATITKISLHTITGVQIKSLIGQGNEFKLPPLSNGLYNLKIHTGDSFYSKKLLIN